jgi:hypothetical protein
VRIVKGRVRCPHSQGVIEYGKSWALYDWIQKNPSEAGHR